MENIKALSSINEGQGSVKYALSKDWSCRPQVKTLLEWMYQHNPQGLARQSFIDMCIRLAGNAEKNIMDTQSIKPNFGARFGRRVWYVIPVIKESSNFNTYLTFDLPELEKGEWPDNIEETLIRQIAIVHQNKVVACMTPEILIANKSRFSLSQSKTKNLIPLYIERVLDTGIHDIEVVIEFNTLDGIIEGEHLCMGDGYFEATLHVNSYESSVVAKSEKVSHEWITQCKMGRETVSYIGSYIGSKGFVKYLFLMIPPELNQFKIDIQDEGIHIHAPSREAKDNWWKYFGVPAPYKNYYCFHIGTTFSPKATITIQLDHDDGKSLVYKFWTEYLVE